MNVWLLYELLCGGCKVVPLPSAMFQCCCNNCNVATPERCNNRGLTVTISLFSLTNQREGEGQRVRNRIIQKMKHQEHLKKEAIERGESVENWDKIVLIGKKIKGSQPASAKSD